MDGFETAALIRARPSSAAHADHLRHGLRRRRVRAARGYSLGAVDYIMTPVDPQVLKTKVTVFVELFRKNEQLKRQAASLEAYAAHLQRLAAASVRDPRGARRSTSCSRPRPTVRSRWSGAEQVAMSVALPASAPFSRMAEEAAGRHELRRPGATRLAALELHALARASTQPAPDVVRGGRGPCWTSHLRMPSAFLPLRGWLAAPLTATDGRPIGWLQLSDKSGGEFSAEDELLLVQLAQMASIAAENIFFSEAREANRLKDQFLATLSHELRTPLQAILTWARMLRDEGAR